ncbi:MAG: DUF167 domain-containing protein [Candidatus Omnitrophica bacterium]|nr:DUF167 domain-containing protein [Candidatus Omnitrophota bacterium]
MIIDVKVIPGSRKNAFVEEAGMYKIHLTAPAVDGKANAALIAFVAEHWAARKSHIKIIKGLKSRFKTIMISD